MKYTLNKKQKELYDFIASYIKDHGYAPTYREIAAGTSVNNLSNVHRIVHDIERRGWLRMIPYESRTFTLVED